MSIRKGFLSFLHRGNEPHDESTPQATKIEQESVESAPPEPVPAPAELQLSQSHTLFRLWELRTGEVGYLPTPRLSLSAPDELIPAGVMDRELNRLNQWVTRTSIARSSKVSPKADPNSPPDVDAEVAVFLTSSKTTAWVIAYPPAGQGKELDQEMLVKALMRENVNYGVDLELINKIPALPDRYFTLHLIARGEAAQPGKDGYVIDLFSRKVEREFKIDEQNQMDYTSLNLVQNANKGDTICDIVPPTEGKPGKNVLGEAIPAADGKKAVVPMGRNTELSEDGTRLVASMTGHVEFTGRTFQIRCILEIPGDVDYSTGHLDYLGDIHIHGDVRRGFTVRAMGSVTVDGIIEATSVESGGDLIVGRGVQGDGKAVIRSHRNIYAKYLEHCSVYVREDLHCDSIINSDVYCDGTVQVVTRPGVICGGSVHSSREVRASRVGNRNNIQTAIVLGGYPCEDYEREELLRELEKMESELEKTERQPDGPAKQTQMSSLRMKTAVQRMKLEKFRKEQVEVQEDQTGDGERCRLVATEVYPGTTVSIGGYGLVANQEYHGCTAMLIDREVRFF